MANKNELANTLQVKRYKLMYVKESGKSGSIHVSWCFTF